MLHINTLRDAEKELRRVGVDPVGVAMMAPKMLSRCVHLHGLQCRQANILKQEMLALGGDAAVARGSVACSIEETDVVLIGSDKQLQRLCSNLLPQPFNLSLLATELSAVLKSAPPLQWRTSRRTLSLKRPLIMGILNITPDSFSDGNCYLDPQKAVEHALKMAEEGADIIDIGGESTKPGAPLIDAQEELRRIMPVIEALSGEITCPISLDTWKSSVAVEAIAAGVEIINDISGFKFDPALADISARSGVGVVLMHTRGTPQNMQSDTNYNDLLGEVTRSLRISLNNAIAAGIGQEYIVADPGIGFAKSVSGNLEILRRLNEFKGLGVPILVGASRKSFIGKTLNRETGDRVFGTAAVVALAVANGASILRVHDVAAMRDAADMAHAVMSTTD